MTPKQEIHLEQKVRQTRSIVSESCCRADYNSTMMREQRARKKPSAFMCPFLFVFEEKIGFVQCVVGLASERIMRVGNVIW